jgi:hypothetical protein
MTPADKFNAFLPLWIAAAAGTWLLFSRGSYQTKRKWAPPFVVVAGLLFMGFIYWEVGASRNFYFAAPVVAVITIVNVRRLRFCPNCGAFQTPNGLFTKVRYCSKCGHDLEEHDSKA